MDYAEYLHFLMVGTGTETTVTYAKLVDIKDSPDIHGEIEAVETTTKSVTQRTYGAGLMSNEVKTYLANYNSTDYATCKDLEGTETSFAEYLGDIEGTDGKFGYKGFLQVRVLGGGAGEPHQMQIRIIPSTGVVDLT